MIKENASFISYLAEELSAEDLEVTSEWQSMEGWSYETFSLGLRYQKNGKTVHKEIIIRREPIGGLLEPYDVSVEYNTISALQDTDITLPATYWYEPDPNVFERPFYTMEKIDGEVYSLAGYEGKDRFNDEVLRESLADDFMKNIIALHTCDWKSLGLDFLGVPEPGIGSAMAQVTYWENMIQRAGYQHHPLAVLANNWLKANAPENDTVVVVHGDYRTGNFIAENGRIKAILDWEMAHLGDPHEELAYITIPVWRSPLPRYLVSHLISEEDFIKRYEAATGIKVDRKKLGYYDVMIAYKTISVALTAANSFAVKDNPDLRPGVFGQNIDRYFALLANTLKTQLET